MLFQFIVETFPHRILDLVHGQVVTRGDGGGHHDGLLAPGLVLQTINRRSCTIMEKAPTKAFSWLKAATTAFTFKTLNGR